MAAIAPITTPAEMLEAAKAFTNEQRYEMAMDLLTALGGWLGGKAHRGRKQKDPNAPKREVKADSYVNFVNHHVLPHLVTLSGKAGLEEAEVKQLKSASCRTQIGSALWTTVKDSEDRIAAFETITLKKVEDAYKIWKANPPAPKAKADPAEKPKRGKKDEDAGAAGGGAAAAAAAEKPKRIAKKKAEAPPPEPAPEDEEGVEEIPVKLVEWEHDFGKGAQTYKRLDYEGMTYIYTADKKYLGAYIEKTNKLKSSVADPLA
jgi:hypothetical protein